MILCFNIEIGDHFTSVYNNHTVQESVTKSNFPKDFIPRGCVLNASTLQLISSRVPTPTLTRLSIKRNDFLLKEYIVVQFDENVRQRHVWGSALCSQNREEFLYRYRDLRPCYATQRDVAYERGVQATRNTINDVHFRELDSRQRGPPFVSPRMKEHVGEKVEEEMARASAFYLPKRDGKTWRAILLTIWPGGSPAETSRFN